MRGQGGHGDLLQGGGHCVRVLGLKGTAGKAGGGASRRRDRPVETLGNGENGASVCGTGLVLLLMGLPRARAHLLLLGRKLNAIAFLLC